jgi:crotonobetainyl-CoA:carnitine CoA-transferase CaiB-like acyl-CoA transferase
MGIMERTSCPRCSVLPNIVDIGTGILGAFATALALYHRQAHVHRQRIGASLAQTATYHQAAFMVDFPGYAAAEPRGYHVLGVGPLQRFYRARDRWFFLGTGPGDEPALAAALDSRRPGENARCRQPA